jgi:hypothetical protein
VLRCANRQCAQRAHREENSFLHELGDKRRLEEDGHVGVDELPVRVDVRAEIDGSGHLRGHHSSALSSRNQIAAQHSVDNLPLCTTRSISVINQKIKDVVAVWEGGEELRAVEGTRGERIVGSELEGLFHDDVHWVDGRRARLEGEASVIFVVAVGFKGGLPRELKSRVALSNVNARVIRKRCWGSDIIKLRRRKGIAGI